MGDESVDQSNDAQTEVAAPVVVGYVPSLNMPGTDMGETNGLYAANTENRVSTDGLSYIMNNPADAISDFSSMIRNVGAAAQTVRTATNGALAQGGYNPNQTRTTVPLQTGTLKAQWAALDTFSKIGFILAVAGVIWALKK